MMYYSESKKGWLPLDQMPTPHLVRAKNKLSQELAGGTYFGPNTTETLQSMDEELLRRQQELSPSEDAPSMEE